MNQRLVDEIAFLMARRCAGLLVNVLDHEQRSNAREDFFAICKEGIEEYVTRLERMESRLRPGHN